MRIILSKMLQRRIEEVHSAEKDFLLQQAEDENRCGIRTMSACEGETADLLSVFINNRKCFGCDECSPYIFFVRSPSGDRTIRFGSKNPRTGLDGVLAGLSAILYVQTDGEFAILADNPFTDNVRLPLDVSLEKNGRRSP